MKLHSRKHPLLLNAVTVLVTVACIGGAAFYFALNASPVPRSKLDQLHGDLTAAGVQALLGKPSVVSSDGSHWQYQKFYCLQSIELVFAPDRTFMSWHWE